MSDMHWGSDPRSGGVALEGRLGQAYDEDAFRHLLSLERARSERSGGTFLLLLVDLKTEPGSGEHIDPAVVPRIFSGLWLCLRATDVVGWYHAERVAGAVLTGLGEKSRTEVAHLVGQRISDTLRSRLPAEVARRLQVRVWQHEPESIDSCGRLYSA